MAQLAHLACRRRHWEPIAKSATVAESAAGRRNTSSAAPCRHGGFLASRISKNAIDSLTAQPGLLGDRGDAVGLCGKQDPDPIQVLARETGLPATILCLRSLGLRVGDAGLLCCL